MSHIPAGNAVTATQWRRQREDLPVLLHGSDPHLPHNRDGHFHPDMLCFPPEPLGKATEVVGEAGSCSLQGQGKIPPNFIEF